MNSKLRATLFTVVCCTPGCLAQDPLVRLKVVKNAPFSAQAVTQTTQTLADGNRLVTSTTATIARDSQGRTRRETQPSDARGGVRSSSLVFIQDPSAGAIFVLDSASHSFRRIATPNAEILQTESAANAEPTGVISVSLGSSALEGGVIADGTRLTRTIPAGQLGIEQPLTVVTEIWYSNDLQTILMKKTVDPRRGETIYKLTDIDRSEPPPALFEIPKEYTPSESREPSLLLDPRSPAKSVKE